MGFLQICINGEDFIGLMGLATDRYAVLCGNFPMVKTLGVPVLRTRIYGTNLVGMFCAGNSKGMLMPFFVSKSDVEKIRGFFRENNLDVEVGLLKEKATALGNMIACNDKGAIISPNLSGKKRIEDILGVEVVKTDIGGHDEVGSCCVCNSRGFLVHPDAEEELDKIAGILGVPGKVGSVNFGFPFVRSGLIANSQGYIAGSRTTGIEMGRAEEALGFI